MKRYNPTAPVTPHHGNGQTSTAEASAAPGIPVTPSIPSTSAGSAIKKVSFAGIAKKKEDTKTAYPAAPDPTGHLSEIAARIIARVAEAEAIESALTTDKQELRCLLTSFYFQNSHGKHDVASSVAVASPEGEVLVVFQNRYKQLPDESAVLAILGDTVGQYFKQSFDLKIEGDKLPQDKAEELIGELQALFAKYNATDALTAKECVKPVSDFHARRHLELTVAQNIDLDEACPIVAMVKTKGRK